MSTFARRRLEIKFQLGKGSFGTTGANTVTLVTHRASANVSVVGGVQMQQLELSVYGMALDVMDQLTVTNLIDQTAAYLNTVTVSAGDDENGLSVCFVGVINTAWVDANASPDVQFHVVASSGYVDAIKPAQPTSYEGTVDVALVMSGIAQQMQGSPNSDGKSIAGIPFNNNGVNVQIANPYLPGTLRDQALALARAANINIRIDENGMTIWPKGKSDTGAVVIVSADTGMVGYPTFTQNGMRFRTLYNPSLVFGRVVEIQSVLPSANKRVTIANITHNLDAETPNGAWFTEVECSLLGQETAIAG